MRLQHKILFAPGHDCITFECKYKSGQCSPGSDGSHGKHGMNLRFLSIGKKGATQFLLYTGWLPVLPVQGLELACRQVDAIPADLGYHSKTRLYRGQPVHKDCEVLHGPCYYDGSGLAGSLAMQALVNGGLSALWRFLDGYYQHTFEKAPFPEAAKYPMPPREERTKE